MMEETKPVLTDECGHHCGVITVGHGVQHIGHCHCPECHDTQPDPIREILDEHGIKNPEFVTRLNERIKKDKAILDRLAESERQDRGDHG